jgi:predicted cupin superfamily sugar epimerase
MEAADIIRELDLKPATCGYMRQTWDNRHGAALYFLITPERGGAVHSLNADQIYHFYLGAPLEVAILSPTGQVERHVLGAFGTDTTTVPQLVIPAGTIHGSRTTGEFTLACTTSFSDSAARATEPTLAQQKQMASAGFQ